MEELCCKSVTGDLSREESIHLERHLRECGECRDLIKEFERLMFFDLPAVAALRLKDELPESVEAPSEEKLLARFNQKLRTEQEMVEQSAPTLSGVTFAPCPIPISKRIRQFANLAIPLLACTAAGFGFAYLELRWHPPTPVVVKPGVAASAQDSLKRDLDEWKSRAISAERQAAESDQKLHESNKLLRQSSMELSQLSGANHELTATDEELHTQLEQQRTSLSARIAELELVRSSLKEETAAKEDFQRQLLEIDARVERQKTELAHLEQVAATVPSRLPVAEHEIETSEAKEILGARDLHIVDVYDIDNAGKASRVYGRVYLVNHNLLVFYAFDLPNTGHRAVAFQAWGFRQPNSGTAESLGLFAMDNAKLNRWTLRVSDPQVLSRIDTLFVTIEPPGGSQSPRGTRLLLASLAGPPNHP